MREDTRQYVVELDGMIWRCQGGLIERVNHLDDVNGDQWLIFDHQVSITRTMIVEAPVKYAEVIVRKKLQESGEVDGPVSLFTYHKEKRGANTTQIFFTALPIKISNQYFEKIRSRDESILLFPVFAIPYRLLKRIGRREPIAIIFQHGQFADLVVGSRKRIYYANRSMAFDTSDDQMSGLWDMVMTDIASAEKENRITVDRVFLLNWVNSASSEYWPGKTDKEVVTIPTEKMTMDGRETHVSFVKALRPQSPVQSFSPPLERVSYCSERILPWLNAALLAAVVLFIFGYFWCNQQTTKFGDSLISNQNRIAALVQGEPVQRISYEETLSFLAEIDYYRKAPSFKRVVNDMSAVLPQGVRLDVFKADYRDDIVTVEVYGKAEAPFKESYTAYQTFTETLKRKGYVLSESQFDTRIRESEFLTRFTKRIR